MSDGGAEPEKGRGSARGGTRRTLLQALALLLVLPLVKWPANPSPAAAQEGAPPDFSDVTTRAAARRLVPEGRLVEISLFPVELGGPDAPPNMGYITPEAAEVRAIVIGTLTRFMQEDVIDRLTVVPDYKGDSIVPSRITMTASHSGEGGSIGTTIDVW